MVYTSIYKKEKRGKGKEIKVKGKETDTKTIVQRTRVWRRAGGWVVQILLGRDHRSGI
jgi:hypothetical protein